MVEQDLRLVVLEVGDDAGVLRGVAVARRGEGDGVLEFVGGALHEFDIGDGDVAHVPAGKFLPVRELVRFLEKDGRDDNVLLRGGLGLRGIFLFFAAMFAALGLGACRFEARFALEGDAGFAELFEGVLFMAAGAEMAALGAEAAHALAGGGVGGIFFWHGITLRCVSNWIC